MDFDAMPLLWHLTKSHNNLIPTLSMSWDPFDTGWHGCGQWVRRNTSKCKTFKKKTFPVATRGRCDFKSWFLCRCHQAGTLVLHSLDSIGPTMSEIQNLVFWWCVIKLLRHATVTRCDEESIFELVFISILFRWHSSQYEVDLMKALGQIRQSKNVKNCQIGH